MVDDNKEKSSILTVQAAEISDIEGIGTPEEQVVDEKQEELDDEEQKESSDEQSDGTQEQKESSEGQSDGKQEQKESTEEQSDESQDTDNTNTDKEDTESVEARTESSSEQLGSESGDITEEEDEEEFVIPEDIDFTGDAEQFIEFMAQGSQAAREHNIFPSVMIGQAILESSMGTSGLTKTNHNIFGIKGTYNGEGSSWATLEDSGGNMYEINDTFRAYPDYYTSILDYLDLLQKDWYTSAGVTSATNPHAQIQAIKNAGYATDSNYVDKVIGVITQYNLTQYDK